MNGSDSDPKPSHNPYFVAGDGDGDGESEVQPLDDWERRQAQLEDEIGGVVETEYGERYRGLVIDLSGSDMPSSV